MPGLMRTESELKTQRELHHARIGHALRVFSKRCRLIQVIAEAVYVKAHAVGNVECFPAQLNTGALCDVKVFAQTGVDAEVTITAQGIARAGFAGICAAEGCQHAGWIFERIRPL